jgi:hypothetical protein
MADTPETPPQDKRSIWMRAWMMILMAMAFQLAATLLGLIAVVQWILALVSDTPNARLTRVGKAVGSYLRQIADFVSFGTEEVPFPFNDWPSSN